MDSVPSDVKRRLSFVDLPTSAGSKEHLAAAVRQGLTSSPKTLPSMFFYDRRGSHLFEEICELPEYYLTRSELEILEAHASEMICAVGRSVALVEFGSGSGLKTRTLLKAALDRQSEVTYLPIDISGDFLKASLVELLEAFPRMRAHGIAAEYLQGLAALPKTDDAKLFLFMGGNVGNMEDDEATAFLKAIRDASGPSDRLLLGFDRMKDPSIVEPAYNDAVGVTEQFNKNVLRRVNAELGADFDLMAFEHNAPFDVAAGRIEMRLVSSREQSVRVRDLDLDVAFREGEVLRTEISGKYTDERMDRIADQAGWQIARRWLDRKQWFQVALLAPVGSEA